MDSGLQTRAEELAAEFAGQATTVEELRVLLRAAARPNSLRKSRNRYTSMRKSCNAKRSAALRNAMLAAGTPRDIYEIVKLQTFLALRGDTFAAREALDRCAGKAANVTDLIALESESEALIDRDLVEAELRMMRESVPSLPD